MGKISAIAVNTFRESVRDKIFYSLLAFAVFMLFFSMIIGSIAIGDPLKIVKDFGLGAISFFGTLIAIFVGIGMVYKEMEKRTIYLILSKPIERWQFLLGKYLGLSLTLLIEVIVMTVMLLALCYQYGGRIPWDLFYAIIPICLELQIVLSVALLFSSFSTPFLSGLLTFAVFSIGHFSRDLTAFADTTDDIVLKKISSLLYYSLPDLEKLNFKSQVVHNLPVSFQDLVYPMLYSVSYTLMVLALAVFIFQQRDMK